MSSCPLRTGACPRCARKKRVVTMRWSAWACRIAIKHSPRNCREVRHSALPWRGLWAAIPRSRGRRTYRQIWIRTNVEAVMDCARIASRRRNHLHCNPTIHRYARFSGPHHPLFDSNGAGHCGTETVGLGLERRCFAIHLDFFLLFCSPLVWLRSSIASSVGAASAGCRSFCKTR